MVRLTITSAEEFVLHSLLSLAFGAVSAALSAGASVVLTQGVNPAVMLSVGIGAFVAFFSAGFLQFRNNPETKQAESDAVSQIQAIANRLEANTGQQLLSHLQGIFGIIQQATQQQPQPPVVVNNHIPAAVSVPAELATAELAPATSNQQFRLPNLTNGSSASSVSPDSIPLAALGKQQ